MTPLSPIPGHRPPELLPASAAKLRNQAGGTRFADALSDALGQYRGLAFSAHAELRLQERGIELGPEDHARLNRALEDAAQKGSRNSLLILDSTALVVSVPNRTVITVMEPDPAANTVITNIDSVVVVGE